MRPFTSKKVPTHPEVANFTEGKSDRLYGVDEPRFLRHSAKMDLVKDKIHITKLIVGDPLSKQGRTSPHDAVAKFLNGKSKVLKGFDSPGLNTGAGPGKIESGASDRPIQVWPTHIPSLHKVTPPFAPTPHLNESSAVELRGKLLKTNK